MKVNLYLCILDPMFDEHFHIRQVSGWEGGRKWRIRREGRHVCWGRLGGP